ncbi:TetR/AcrR family transcriptional regulator C-terminal domain-containing protein [Nocardia sp. CC201C]|uniref:TetR/AcrR family transcriptional regulator C-terminal domain-containing protein n=1 Tax=Nocardia sp. CC201C TaxID=3044575 RepID=UPI0024A80622|nr:TetR/AcrR family transcriptional regulator C-terminal domain-containing protein [Nocardia sp. CC201C]
MRNVGDLAATLQTLDARGLLCVPDPATAAQQLTWLVVGAPLNARMLDATAPVPDTVDAAIDVFLTAYRPHPG